MARNMYGATSADFTLTSGGRVVPGAVLTLWSARTGGTQITDLLDRDSVACTTVTSGADGSVVYYGPDSDADTHWADSGQGSRIGIRPVDITGEPPTLEIGTVDTGTADVSISGSAGEYTLDFTLPGVGADGVDTAAIQDSAVTSAKVAASTFAAFSTVGNLLPANEASGGDTLGDTTGFALSGTTSLARDTGWAYSGSGSILFSKSGAGQCFGVVAGATNATSGDIPVTAGETYTIRMVVRSAASTDPAKLRFRWFTSGGYAISYSSESAFTNLSSSGSIRQFTAVAPATAAYACGLVEVTASAAMNFNVDEVGLWKGAGGRWAMPGVPIAHLGIRPNPSNTAEVQIWNDATATWITV